MEDERCENVAASSDDDGTSVSTPKISGFSLIDLHTFVSAPQNDESVVLNALYEAVVRAAAKTRMGPVTIHYDNRTGRIWFRAAAPGSSLSCGAAREGPPALL